MHPAKSVIFFTTASGAGYGIIVWLGFLGMLGFIPADRFFGIVVFGIALILIGGGLLSSTFHLGHPERAWRAFSQWRSSWLSREGVAAVVTFAPIGAYGLFWVLFEQNTGWTGIIGLTAGVASILTVYCTSMIYASLKTIPAWSNMFTPWSYVILSLSTGAALLAPLLAFWRFPVAQPFIFFAATLTIAGLIVKLAYWRSIAATPAVSTAESATGLGDFGSIRLVDAPHSQSNYLLEEMGFQIARKHADKLRMISILVGFISPAVLFVMAAWFSSFAVPLALAAVLASVVGIVVERWLFFAEAKHVVTLYYGERRV